MKKFLFFLNCLVFLSYLPAKYAYADRLEQILRDHTLVYTDPNTGIKHTIYIGRFGNHYDEYFPCKFLDGTWLITKHNYLCLEDRVNKERRKGQKCLKAIVEKGKITFLDTADKIAHQYAVI